MANRNLRTILTGYKLAAHKRQIPFSITDAYAKELLQSRCIYCGYAPAGHFNGIDRVDNKMGYVLGNVVPCCKWCNLAKGRHSAAEFAEWIRSIPLHRLIPDLQNFTPTPEDVRPIIQPATTFAMIPMAILNDPTLIHRDIRIYGVLAGARRGPHVSIGTRRIAALAHCDKASACSSIRRLTVAGHLEINDGRGPLHGHRTRYRLLSPLFGATDKPEKTQDVITPECPKRIVPAPLLQCAKCHKPSQRLPITGICRSCTNAARLIQTIDQRLDERLKTA